MGFPAEDVSNMLTRDKNQAGVERPIEVTNWEIDRNRTLVWVDSGLTMKLYWVFLALFRMSELQGNNKRMLHPKGPSYFWGVNYCNLSRTLNDAFLCFQHKGMLCQLIMIVRQH